MVPIPSPTTTAILWSFQTISVRKLFVLLLWLLVQWGDLDARSPGDRAMQLRKLTELDQRLIEDFEWAEHAPEVQQNADHFGKLVVVYNKRVLTVGRDRQAIVAQAAQRAGVPGDQLVVVLVPTPEMWEIPHLG